MEFRILGPLEIVDQGRHVPIGGGRQRALLGILLLHANEVVSTDRLIDALWGERPPDTAPKALQGYVSQLRKVLDPARSGTDEVLVTRSPGYALRIARGELDLHHFERLAAEGRSALAGGDARTAARRLRESLALWRGPALSDFAFEPFAKHEITRLEELRLAVLEDRVEADLALGRQAELVGELESLVAEQRLRERPCGQLMLALYRSGRQAEALEVYKGTRRVLVEELGLEPSERLQQLERAILTHDPALDAPPHVPLADVAERPPLRAMARRRARALALLGAVLVLGAAVAAAATELRGDGEPLALELAPNSLGAIDPETNRLVAVVPVGTRPAAVAAGVGAIWVANAEDGTVSRIDPHSRAVVKTIGIGAPASDIAVADGAVWVANGTDGTISRIDPRSNAVVETVDLAGRNALAPNAAYAVAVGAGGVWVASGGRTIIRIDARRNDVVRAIPVAQTPVAITFGEGAIWVATLDGKTLRVEPRTNTITGRTASGALPIAVAAGAGAVWVCDAGRDAVWRIDADTGSVTQTISVGARPEGIDVGEGSIWVANAGDGTVSRIDPASNEVRQTIRVGQAPSDVAVGEGAVWVVARAAT